MLPSSLKFFRDGGNELIYQSIETDAKKPLLVYVFGGYLGDSSQSWLKTQRPEKLHVFEPVPVYANRISERFRGDDAVSVHVFGIGTEDKKATFVMAGQATTDIHGSRSSQVSPGEKVEVIFRNPSALGPILGGKNRTRVLEINIEGGEYDLIRVLSKEDLIQEFTHLFVQFHELPDSTTKELASCREILELTHELVWSYEMVWDYWRKI